MLTRSMTLININPTVGVKVAPGTNGRRPRATRERARGATRAARTGEATRARLLEATRARTEATRGREATRAKTLGAVEGGTRERAAEEIGAAGGIGAAGEIGAGGADPTAGSTAHSQEKYAGSGGDMNYVVHVPGGTVIVTVHADGSVEVSPEDVAKIPQEADIVRLSTGEIVLRMIYRPAVDAMAIVGEQEGKGKGKDGKGGKDHGKDDGKGKDHGKDHGKGGK